MTDDNDGFLDALEVEDEQPVPEKENSTIRELRQQLRRRDKDMSRLETELTQYRQQVTTSKVKSIFAETGHNEKLADLFLKVNPDIADVTPETVTTFVSEYGLGSPTPEPVVEVPEPTGFAPTAVGTPVSGKKTYSRQEWLALYQTDPQAALAASAEGRVDKTPPNFSAPLGN